MEVLIVVAGSIAATALAALAVAAIAPASLPTTLTSGVPPGAARATDASANAGTALVVGQSTRPLALVYRGPASCVGCSEAVVELLRTSRFNFQIEYIGPSEKRQLVASSFSGATLYAQPGGDTSVARASRLIGALGQRTITDFVAGGGRYLGFCQGAYLAGSGPGLGLLAPGNTGQYIKTRGASTRSARDTVIPVKWAGRKRDMYFQDGPYMTGGPSAGQRILARYTNGLIAALVKPYGAGRVGVVGPHPEAPRSWYRAAGLIGSDEDGRDTALGHELIRVTMRR